MSRPVVWSIAGTDSGGGAGLSADQRTADAFGVHLCGVVAAVTAQNSQRVEHIAPMPSELIDAQLRALGSDMPPVAIKTGLLGGAQQIITVARAIDRLRAERPVALVVDPVLAASTGAQFADADALAAYRDELLPRATVVTPNRREAYRLLNERLGDDRDLSAIPELARALRAYGAGAVCITGGDALDIPTQALDWMSSEHASGWLTSQRIPTPNTHGTGCTFATAIACALTMDFVPADAIILAKMATTHAIRQGYQAGAGAGPVHAHPGFADDRTLLPRMSWGEAPWFAQPRAFAPRRLGLYAIVESIERLHDVLAAGVRTIQLRIKRPARPDTPWHSALRSAVQQGVAACRAANAELFINDHWTIAQECGASGVHLGQEDLLALGEEARRAIVESGIALGISTHSLWELCRARSLSPRYIACGPVWPTLTKDMPWRPQGLENLRWWRHMAGTPVVAIGGILEPEQARAASRCGVDGVCIVRALGASPQHTAPKFITALEIGRGDPLPPVPAFPRPSLVACHHDSVDCVCTDGAVK
ncbi:MAG TPA: bifunctional hydroxymethylpyrimidine kinase/phosphomethylpyrimidine kinase [Burkholderiaceae bacterium]|nr:bifunctional hydroxymethylpyrimidine kinase/phosphomethylpyrimidine kinase [Burkholderiaceae bacterium]